MDVDTTTHKQNIVCRKTHFFPAVVFYPRHPTAKLESSVVGTRVGQQCFSGQMVASWPLNVVMAFTAYG